MREEHLQYLVCPVSGNPLQLRDEVRDGGRVKSGVLHDGAGREYPVVDFIPRFVPAENYAENFGIQWNIHNRTQYDDSSGHQASSERFRKEMKWPERLEGKTVLEIGSGSGRFTTEALKTGAMVVSLDYSDAVKANYASNGASDNLLLVQASAFEMPFRKSSFDYAFCIGVLQHTPDPQKAFREMISMVRTGGRVASDIYRKDFFRWAMATKYWVRPITRTMDPQKLYPLVKKWVDLVWPIVRLNRRLGRLGHSLNWRLLVADDSRVIPGADDRTLREWAYLDTYDMLAPRYDLPASVRTFRRWHEDAGLKDIEVHKGYNGVEGRGTV